MSMHVARRSTLLVFAAAVVVAAGWRPAASQDQDDPFARLPPSVWQRARQNGLVMIHRPAPKDITWRTQIVRNDEPGAPLIVSGRVVAPDGRTPAAGVTVYAYNTDADGYYGEHHSEYPPRLYGWMKTDEAGRFEVRTIRPGSYPGMRVPAHVHFVVWGGGYEPQWVEELKFEGDPYLTREALAEDARLGEFRSVRPVVRGADGVWRCQHTIRLQRTTNFR